MPRFLPSTWRRSFRKSPSTTKPEQQNSIPPLTPKQQNTPPLQMHQTSPLLTPIILSTPHVTTTVPPSFFPNPKMGNCTWHNLLTSPHTASDTFTVGIGVCKPKTGTLALHRHKQAEFYYVLSGTGTVIIEGQNHAVTVGDVVFIPGDAEHGVFNSGADEFRWLFCFGVGGFEEVVYRFSEQGVVA